MSLKELFQSQNFTQNDIVAELKKMNCYKYQQQVSWWITGKFLPDAYSIWCLSKILGVSAVEVLSASLKSAGRI